MKITIKQLIEMVRTWKEVLYLQLVVTVVAKTDHRTDAMDCTSLLKFDDQLFFILQERMPMNGIPTDFNLNWRTNDLFFTLVTNNVEMYLLILLNNLNGTVRPDRRFHVIRTPSVGQTSAVDNTNNIIYIGTDNGVYTYSYNDNTSHYAAHGEDVMYLAVSADGNELYIATYPYNRVEKLTAQRKIERLPTIRNGHGIKSDIDFIYYYSASTKTPYLLRKNTTDPKKIMNIKDARNVFFYVAKTGQTQAMDIKSNLYFINSDNAMAEYMGTFHIDRVSGFGMDSLNNIYIGTDQEIIKFQAYKYNPCKAVMPMPFLHKTKL